MRGIYGIEEISAIVLFSCYAGISLLFQQKTDSDFVRISDIGVGLIFLLLQAALGSQINWMAVTGLCLYVLLFTRDEQGTRILFGPRSSPRRRAAMIIMALTVPMLWSKVLFSFLAKYFLEIDASLVGWIMGTPRLGNVLRFADGSGNMVVFPGCSSLANLSLAFLCWVTMTQWLDRRFRREDILWCGLACCAVVVINVTRMAIMGQSQWYYQTFHNGWGAPLVNAIELLFIVGFTMIGVRRELFQRD